MARSKNHNAQAALLELTSLPTAAGREHRVVAWVRRWIKRRRALRLREDEHGNLMIARTGAASRKPIVFAAHMDHPAFVVTRVAEHEREVEAELRGGVDPSYFKVGTPMELCHADEPPQRGTLARAFKRGDDGDHRITVTFDEPVCAATGDVVRWSLGEARITGNRLHAPACDDLAAVAAALEAIVRLTSRRNAPDVRVLLTRAEEIGFIGAMAACRSGLIPQAARIIALENSKSFADSPLSGGPIVRVGDRTSTFDPDLTYRVGRVAAALGENDRKFRWQRKLMPGGTCEASAYQTLGYTATCVCLPLANYHNMNEDAGRIDREHIDLDDYRGMVRLLVAIGDQLDRNKRAAGLKQRLGELYRQRRNVLREPTH